MVTAMKRWRKVRKNGREGDSMKERKKQCDGKTKPQKQRSADFLPSRHRFLFRQPALWESVNEKRWPRLSTEMHVSNSMFFTPLNTIMHTPCSSTVILNVLDDTHLWSYWPQHPPVTECAQYIVPHVKYNESTAANQIRAISKWCSSF